MRRFLLSLLIMAGLIMSADAGIVWLEKEYNFGSFPEEGGPRKGQVRLVNEGSEPTVINRVKSTCGCTVAGFTEGLIEPGDTAFVWFTYNPTGRPGRFLKHIKVYTGADNDVTSIALSGTVIGSSSTLASNYPVEAGPMRLSTNAIGMGKVVFGRARHEYISGYNQSSDTLRLHWTSTPMPLSLGVSNKEVAPGDLFTLGIYFNSRDEAESGPVEYSFTLFPFEGEEDGKLITITADIVPDTSGMTEQEIRNAPSAMIYPTVIELGSLTPADKPVKFEFNIRNEGHTPLDISRICLPGADSKALTIKQMPTRIKPGKEHKVKGSINPAEIQEEGPFVLEVQTVSNDLLHPSRTLRLVGTMTR